MRRTLSRALYALSFALVFAAYLTYMAATYTEPAMPPRSP